MNQAEKEVIDAIAHSLWAIAQTQKKIHDSLVEMQSTFEKIERNTRK